MFTKGCFDRGMICTYKGIFLFREHAKSVIRNYSGGKPNNFKGLTLMRRKNHWPIFKGVNYQIITNSSTTIWVLRKWIVKKCLSQDLWCKVLTFLPLPSLSLLNILYAFNSMLQTFPYASPKCQLVMRMYASEYRSLHAQVK